MLENSRLSNAAIDLPTSPLAAPGGLNMICLPSATVPERDTAYKTAAFFGHLYQATFLLPSLCGIECICLSQRAVFPGTPDTRRLWYHEIDMRLVLVLLCAIYSHLHSFRTNKVRY